MNMEASLKFGLERFLPYNFLEKKFFFTDIFFKSGMEHVLEMKTSNYLVPNFSGVLASHVSVWVLWKKSSSLSDTALLSSIIVVPWPPSEETLFLAVTMIPRDFILLQTLSHFPPVSVKNSSLESDTLCSRYACWRNDFQIGHNHLLKEENCNYEGDGTKPNFLWRLVKDLIMHFFIYL